MSDLPQYLQSPTFPDNQEGEEDYKRSREDIQRARERASFAFCLILIRILPAKISFENRGGLSKLKMWSCIIFSSKQGV
jgi:hypothetical protein